VPARDDVPLLSVIIATLNRDETLCNTLRYFFDNETYPRFEVIVIDQSTRHDPKTFEFLAAHTARMTYIKTGYKNLPRARNEGARLARGEIVVYVDDDVEPRAGFLGGHARPYADPAVLGVTGPAPEPDQPLRGRADIGEAVWTALLERRQMRFDVSFAFSAQWAVGCNMSFRRQVIDSLGGFDENFLGSPGEDAEFSHRVRKAGLIQYTPAAHLVHLKAPTGGDRDALGRARYVWQTAFCVNYFWFKVEAPWGLRHRMTLHTFRQQVLNRRTLRNGRWFPFALAFLRGIRDSERVIRQLRGRARAPR
jgi:GT2 family glycosyltransferase